MTLDTVEFIRRFLLHILPPGFVKIRHFGFLSNRRRKAALALCRKRLPQPVPPSFLFCRRGSKPPLSVVDRSVRQERCTLAVAFQPENFWPVSIRPSQRISWILHDHQPRNQKLRPETSAATQPPRYVRSHNCCQRDNSAPDSPRASSSLARRLPSTRLSPHTSSPIRTFAGRSADPDGPIPIDHPRGGLVQVAVS
jgi:hypothetical protein